MRLLRRRERALEGWPLSNAVHDAWSAGPAAPAPDYLIAAIRPAMLRIDREHEARGGLFQRLVGLRGRWAPRVPLALGGLAVAALALLLVTSTEDRSTVEFAPPSPSLRSAALEGPVPHALKTAVLREPESRIYDLEIEDARPGALLVFEGDDATIIWVGDATESFDGASRMPSGSVTSTAAAGSAPGSWQRI